MTAPPCAVEGESEVDAVADAADERLLDVRASVAREAGVEAHEGEGRVRCLLPAKRLVDAAPKACCPAGVQEGYDLLVLRFDPIGNRRLLVGRAWDPEGGREALQGSGREVEPVMHVHQEGVVGLERLASDRARADGHRVRDRPRVLGRRKAAEAAVEDQTAADEVDDRACAGFLRKPIVRLGARVIPDARASRKQLGPDKFEFVIVGVAARFEGARLAWSQARRPFGE